MLSLLGIWSWHAAARSHSERYSTQCGMLFACIVNKESVSFPKKIYYPERIFTAFNISTHEKLRPKRLKFFLTWGRTYRQVSQEGEYKQIALPSVDDYHFTFVFVFSLVYLLSHKGRWSSMNRSVVFLETQVTTPGRFSFICMPWTIVQLSTSNNSFHSGPFGQTKYMVIFFVIWDFARYRHL